MKKFWFTFFAITALFLALFGIAQALEIPLLSDPGYLLEEKSWIAALVGTTLLVADIILPVPSSLIMVANGALFGLWIGAGLSLLGGLGAAMIGYLLGRMGKGVYRRFVNDAEYARGSRFMQKWGALAILLSRPVPLLAETVAVIAGANGMRFRTLVLCSFLGLIPTALLYAYTGAYSATMESSSIAFLLVIGTAGVFWVVGRMRTSKHQKAKDYPASSREKAN